MTSDADRRERLLDLIRLRLSVDAAVGAVKVLPWDSDVELVVLARRDVANQLKRFLRGELSAADLESWADAIEGREDIGFEPEHEDLLHRFVFETANPVLAEPLSDAYGRRWLGRFE